MGETGRVRIAIENVQFDGGAMGGAEAERLPAGPYVRITVADDGRGMDDDTRGRVFEPFFTTKAGGPSEGLGLASVYGIIRQAGGHIEVASRLEAGTAFFLYLPRVERPAPQPESAHGPAPDPGTSRRILVVEDEPPVRGLIRKVLERKGYDVLTASDGETALQVAADRPGEIDLLIADLVMPGMSGREVAEKLAIMEPDMATILISGYTTDDLVRAGIEQGDYVFVPKPFSPETLTTRVAEVLRARTTR
jgi:CheY-like chemotaxis protein